MSLRARVTLAAAAVVATAMAGVGVFVYVTLRSGAEADLRRQLTDRAALATALAPRLTTQELADQLSTQGTVVTVRDGGRVVNGTARPTPPGPAPTVPPTPPGGPVASAVADRGDDLVLTSTLPGGAELELAVGRSAMNATLSRVILLELGGSAIALLLAVALLWRVLGRALRPLDDVTGLALGIAREGADGRVTVDAADTELNRLGHAFNELLDAQRAALDAETAARARMGDFLADASHELRTPLAGIQATGESLLRDGEDRAEREEGLVTLVRESRRAGALVSDLLAVARDEPLTADPIDVDLATLADQARRRAAPLDLHVDVELRAASVVRGDPDALVGLLAALLDNARRVAQHVLIEVDDGRIAVHDDGPGVPAADRERIFERLVRLDAGRDRHRGGAGLGLAIARRVATAHDADLRCEASPRLGGACFVLEVAPAAQVMAYGSP